MNLKTYIKKITPYDRHSYCISCPNSCFHTEISILNNNIKESKLIEDKCPFCGELTEKGISSGGTIGIIFYTIVIFAILTLLNLIGFLK